VLRSAEAEAGTKDGDQGLDRGTEGAQRSTGHLEIPRNLVKPLEEVIFHAEHSSPTIGRPPHRARSCGMLRWIHAC
jgi:hypothetical protein